MGTTIVGRDTTSGISLDDPHVSRRHFQLEYQGQHRIYVQDLQSANGTFVNGKQVLRAPVAHGDEIVVGPYRFVISHPAYSRPKVIPFPNQRTEPGIKLSELEVSPTEVSIPPPAPRTIGASREVARVHPKTFSLGMLLIAIGMAGGLAAGMHVWMQRSRSGVPELVKATPPKPKPRAVLTPMSKMEVVRTPMKSIPRAGEKKVASPRPARRAIEIPVPEEEVNLDKLRVLDDLTKKDELSGADRMTASVQTTRETESLKRRGEKAGSAQGYDVDIILPRMEELKKVQKTALLKFNPNEYSMMLRRKLEGVESCYIENAGRETEGQLTVVLTIASNGSIRKGKIENSTFKNLKVGNCILEKVRVLKVDPPPWDAFAAGYTFRFGKRQIRF